jgi:hypothetical protein
LQPTVCGVGLRVSRFWYEDFSACMLSHSLSESWKIGVLWGGQVSKVSSCCPTESLLVPVRQAVIHKNKVGRISGRDVGSTDFRPVECELST